MAIGSFDASKTSVGQLSPWELAKAVALKTVLDDMSAHMEAPVVELVGKRVDVYIAERLEVHGGGQPTPRAVRKVLARCKDPTWYPGKPRGQSGGRPPIYTEHQKDTVARVAMDLKRKLYAPTPRRVRARLPQASRNPSTQQPMSNSTVQRIFTSRCYDETEDDPWQFLTCVSQDVLPTEVLPKRVAAAKHILRSTTTRSWYNHVAIDPCYTLLPKTLEKFEEQRVAAMGKKKWMSQGSKRSGPNGRALATTKTQGGTYHAIRVDWTPVFI